mmetsp:Transcript_25938/g.48371  ORF Transcript_25938/g.48371 Transcript_25938/m.48371 type:complete len:221 (-) Transcript_25938:328-990(-)
MLIGDPAETRVLLSPWVLENPAEARGLLSPRVLGLFKNFDFARGRHLGENESCMFPRAVLEANCFIESMLRRFSSFSTEKIRLSRISSGLVDPLFMSDRIDTTVFIALPSRVSGPFIYRNCVATDICESSASLSWELFFLLFPLTISVVTFMKSTSAEKSSSNVRISRARLSIIFFSRRDESSFMQVRVLSVRSLIAFFSNVLDACSSFKAMKTPSFSSR